MDDDANPSVDDDVYASEWASIEEDDDADAADRLPAYLDIVERMLTDDVAAAPRAGVADLEPELGTRLAYAREIAAALDRGADLEPGDVDAAVAAVHVLYRAARPASDRGEPGAIDPLAAEQLAEDAEAGAYGESETDR